MGATKKKSNDHARDTIVVAKLVCKTLIFVHNTTIKFCNEIERLRVEKEIDAEIKRDLIPKFITAATKATTNVLDCIDLTNTHKPLNGHINKRITTKQTKLQRELKATSETRTQCPQKMVQVKKGTLQALNFNYRSFVDKHEEKERKKEDSTT